MYTRLGTAGYAAPELCEELGYDCRVDIWSLGVMLLALLGKMPALNDNEYEMNTDDYA